MTTAANPGDRFIWQEPFKPVLTIMPNKARGITNGSIKNTKPGKKTFFLGFNRLGDFLCTTAVIHGFRKQHPDTEIIYIVQDAPYCRVLEGNPDIDRVVYSKELYQYGEKILDEEWLTTLPVEIEEPSLLYRFNIHEVCLSQPSVFNDHISKGFARVLQIPIDSVRPVVTLSQEDMDAADALVNKPFIVISMHSGSEIVGAGWKMIRKDWVFESWLRLTKNLCALGDFEIIAVGSESDSQVECRYFKNLYGLPIKTVAALLKKAACVVSVESGISHLCHAVDAAMVLIFSRHVCFPWAFPREASCCRVIYKDPLLISPDEVLCEIKSVLAQKGYHSN